MATRAEVAKLAGVSASTVSYALSGDRSIKEETRKRVLKAVAQLNYRPNFAAGALAGGKSKTLALLSPSGEFGIALITLEDKFYRTNPCCIDSGHNIIITLIHFQIKRIDSLTNASILVPQSHSALLQYGSLGGSACYTKKCAQRGIVRSVVDSEVGLIDRCIFLGIE